MGSPLVRILMDRDGGFVYWEGGTFLSSAEFYHLEPDDSLIVRLRNTGTTWSISLPYGPPTINMSP